MSAERCDCATGAAGVEIFYCPLHHAAPALLEALEGIHRVLGYVVYLPEATHQETWVYEKARAAIAAARGEA